MRVDAVRPGTAEELAAALTDRGSAGAVPSTMALVEQAPESVVVVRDAEDALCGFSIAVTTANAPPAAEADPLLGTWLAHARSHPEGGDTVLWRDAVDLTADVAGNPSSPVLALMTTAVLLRSGLPNPRYLYLPIDPENEPAVAFASGVGARHVPELDHRAGRMVIQCHVFDTGAAGLVGAVYGAIYGELGLPVPAHAPGPGPAAAGSPVDHDAVRDALRSFQRPGELASSPLASGTTPEERAESVRRRLGAAVAGAFGASGDEELQRRIIELGYLDPSTTHEAAADALHLSRAAYFRRLRQAVERVAAWVLAHPG
jgi:hypothetical protein